MNDTPEQIALKKSLAKANKKLRKAIDIITVKTPESLTDHEIGVLKARVTYLTIEERKKFASILKVKKVDPEDEDPGEDIEFKDMPYKELQKMAKKRGLKYTAVSTKNLIKSLEENA